MLHASLSGVFCALHSAKVMGVAVADSDLAMITASILSMITANILAMIIASILAMSAFLLRQNIWLTRFTPATRASISSLVLYKANEARTTPCTPSRSMTGCAQW